MVQRNTSIINTPRINDYNPQKEKENILFVRKSHELGLSYCNQHIKKQSYENPINKSNITQNLEKDKKSPIASSLAVTKSKNRNVITPNSNKPKENRSLTPNTKEQIKFEGKIKKSVQRQFLKTSEKDDNKTTTFRKK